MSGFHYLAISPTGSFHSGKIAVPERAEALARLRGRGWVVLRLKSLEPTAGELEDLAPYLAARDRVLLFLQLGLLMRSGLNIVRSLEIVGGADAQSPLYWLCQFLAKQVSQRGISLSAAMRLLPETFTPMMTGMVQLGEETGALPGVLGALAVRLDQADRLQKRLVNALVYPACLCTVTVAVMFILMEFLVPQVVAIVARDGQSLPLLTRWVLALCSPLALKLVLGSGLVGLLCLLVLRQREDGGEILDRWTDRIPKIGRLKLLARGSSFCFDLHFMLERSVGLLQAFRLMKSPLRQNSPWARMLTDMGDRLSRGEEIETIFRHPLLPPLVSNLATVGAEMESLPRCLGYCAEQLQGQLEYEMETLLQMLEPLLTAACGVLSGLVCVAAFLPVYGLLTGAGA
ncbi:type II secretion system F family protein [bacterium]|nr:type II secretion system F family protein [bacterium]